jgi:hypothetical protein
MNFLVDNLVLIISVLVLIGIIVRYSIRSYFVEKRRHLSSMMQEDAEVTNHSSNIDWKDVFKDDKEK